MSVGLKKKAVLTARNLATMRRIALKDFADLSIPSFLILLHQLKTQKHAFIMHKSIYGTWSHGNVLRPSHYTLKIAGRK